MNRVHVLLLVIILSTALGLRIIGLQFGRPLVVNPNESELTHHALEAVSNRGNPGWFGIPSGMIYITVLVEGLRYVAAGTPSSVEFWRSFLSDPFPHHLWIRIVVAFSGVAGVYAIWLLGREWDRGRERIRFLGWGGATLLAVHFLHLRDSHFATVDVPFTTAVTLALWLLLRESHQKQTNIRRLLGVALGIGLTCGIRYSGWVLVIPLFYVGFVNAIRDERVETSFPWMVGSASLLLLTVTLGFLITTPYALLDATRFWRDVGALWLASGTSLLGSDESPLLGYLNGPWMWGGGKLLGVLGFFGFMMAVLRHEAEDRVLLAFALPFLALTALQPRVEGRWFLPMIVVEILWAVRFIAVYTEHPWAVSLVGPRTRKTIAVGLVLFMASCNLIPGLRLLFLLRQEDSRAMAASELENRLEEEDYVLVTVPPYFGPPVPEDIQVWQENRLVEQRHPTIEGNVERWNMIPLDELIDEGVNKVVFSSFYWQIAAQPHLVKLYPDLETYRTFVQDLRDSGKVLFEIESTYSTVPFHLENLYVPTFDLWRWERPGPTIRLYELPRSRQRSL